MEERASVLARETGCLQRERKFSGADLLQTWVFGWLTHPDASLEQLASTAEVRHVSVSDTAIDKRFTPECAEFLHQVLQEMTAVVVQAEHEVPLPLLKRFSAVILEDASTITLPDELGEVWRGCGGNQSHTKAALKLHTRCELRRGQVQGPLLTDGRTSERISPLADEPVEPGSLYVADLGYFNLQLVAKPRQAGGYTLTRLQAGTALYSPHGQRLPLQHVLPARVGQLKELRVLVGAKQRMPMRLLLLRVPKAIADKRREDLLRDGQRRGQTISEETLHLADWTILITDVRSQAPLL